MIITQRIEYINKHKEKGDLVTVSEALSLNYSTVRDIIKGKSEGENSEKVLYFIEKVISNRMKKKQRLEKKYASKLEKS